MLHTCSLSSASGFHPRDSVPRSRVRWFPWFQPNDPITITDSDLVKIDLGAQINGYIADTAVTVCYDPNYDNLVQTAEDALKNAISMIKIGVKASDIGKCLIVLSYIESNCACVICPSSNSHLKSTYQLL